jgi:hypothetical protein
MNIIQVQKRETAVRAYDGKTVVWGLCLIEGYLLPVWVLLKVLP